MRAASLQGGAPARRQCFWRNPSSPWARGGGGEP
ncbi:MAG: hypothetical protein ACJAR5_002494, partial [Pseudophaeobacter arcticus]